MKKILIPIFVALTIVKINGQNIFYDDFQYSPIDSLEGQGLWFRSGINSNENIKVVAPGLDYNGYPGSGKGNSALLTNQMNGDVLLAHFNSIVEDGPVYMAFMLRVDSIPLINQEGYCISFNHNSSTDHNTRLIIKTESKSAYKLGVQKVYEEDIDFASSEFKPGTTYLVVLKYSFLQGTDNDISSLYVIQGAVPSREPATPQASTRDGYDYLNQASVVLSNNYARDGVTGMKIYIDGIRVGKTWESSVLGDPSGTDKEISDKDSKLECIPNPFSDRVQIKFYSPDARHARIRIIDSQGKVCTQQHLNIIQGGVQKFDWEAADLPAGIYHCEIIQGENQWKTKLFKTR